MGRWRRDIRNSSILHLAATAVVMVVMVAVVVVGVRVGVAWLASAEEATLEAAVVVWEAALEAVVVVEEARC